MNKKGQWMALDFLLAMILIVLSIGILLQFMEVKSYTLKEQALDLELQRVGETASNLLVSSPDLVCDLVGVRDTGVVLGGINNCLTQCSGDDTGCKKITKESLGLTADFECEITATGGTISDDCIIAPANIKNIYSVKRKVIFSNETDETFIQKDALLNCIKGETCSLTEGEITLKVWRA